MIMDIKNLGAICDNPIIRGKHLTEFVKKLKILTKEEIKASFEVTCKDMLTILSETVPCVGCRKRYVMVSFRVVFFVIPYFLLKLFIRG